MPAVEKVLQTPGAPAAAAPAPAAAPAAAAPGTPAPAAAAPAAPAAGAPAAGPKVPALGDGDDGIDTTPSANGKPAAVPALGDDEPEDPAAPAAPIEYKFTPPEGAAPYREQVVGAYVETLQGLETKLPPAEAQKLLEKMMPVIASDLDAQVKEAQEAQRVTWQKELEARHGADLPQVMRFANRFLKQCASPEIVKFITGSVLRSNPDFITMLAAGGQRLTPDRPPKNQNGTAAPPVQGTALERAAAKHEQRILLAQANHDNGKG